jgi:Nitrile hydratase beta subunit
MTEPTRKTEPRDDTGRAVHDVGGMDFGPIDRHEHDPALWEKRVDAMMILLYARKQTYTVDAMRRVIEDYGQQAYDSTEYYEKWVRAMRNLLVEQEILSRAEIEMRMRDVAAKHRTDGRAVAADTVDW